MQKSYSNYLKAILWFVMFLATGCINNTLLKYIGNLMPPWQVAFYRCFFSAVTLLPFMFYHGLASFKTRHIGLHIVRGILFFVSMNLWSYGVQQTPIATATIVSFTTPLFVLFLAPFLLKERVTWPMWVATLLSFGGIFLALQPSSSAFVSSLLLLSASALFGLLDVLNKKQINQESMLRMLFYSSFFAAILFALPVAYSLTLPRMHALWWPPLCLGIGNNLHLYCLLKAFTLTSASSLAPFRYLELPLSVLLGYLFFQELPSNDIYLGAAVIVPCTLFIVYYQQSTSK